MNQNKDARKYALAATLLLTLGAAATGAHAQTWTKTGNPGNLPATAQVTQGNGPLQEITGTFSVTQIGTDPDGNPMNVANPDLFEIRIDGSALFSATTVGQESSQLDSQLFLFNAAGGGVYFNDDASNFTLGSLINPSTSPVPGLYYIGITTYGSVPRSGGTTAASDIFTNPEDDTTHTVSDTGLIGPKPGMVGPLTNWYQSNANLQTGAYGIALTGATYAIPAAAAVPESSTALSLGVLALLSAALLAVQSFRRTKSTSVQPV